MSSTATFSDETHESAGSDQSGRHPINIVHLVMALIFLGVLAVWGIAQGNALDNADLRWLLPMPLLLAGATGLIAIALSGRSRTKASGSGTATQTDVGPTDEDVSMDEMVNDETEEIR